MIVAPLVNKLLLKLNKAGFVRLLFIAWLFWYTIPATGGPFFQLQKGVFFYMLGAYMNLYRRERSVKYRDYLFAAVSWILLSCIGYTAAHYGSLDGSRNAVFFRGLTILETSMVPVCVIFIFRFFDSMDIGYKRAVNQIASTTFGIYLIHDSIVFRNIIWNYIFHVDTGMYSSEWFLFMTIGAVALVFVVCSLLDRVRLKWIEPVVIERTHAITNRMMERYFVKED